MEKSIFSFIFLSLIGFSQFALAVAPSTHGANGQPPRRSGSECMNESDEKKARGPVVCSLGSNGQKFPVSLVSKQQAEELFDVAKNVPGIAYGYVDDGCYARAHSIARKLEERGILVGKIFTTGELAAYRPTAGPLIRQKDGTETQDRYVKWDYHVAPFVMIDTGGAREVFVIDPSLFLGIVKVQEWMAAQLVTGDSYLNEIQISDRHAYVMGSPSSWRLSHSNDTRRLMNGILTNQRSVRREDFNPADIEHSERTNRNYLCIQDPSTCVKRSR